MASKIVYCSIKKPWMITVLITVVVSACSLTPSKPVTNNNPVADIMYLIPTDASQLEEWAKPERLIANQQNLSIGVTSDWKHINQLANEKKTFAVIIHHAAIDQVNQEELAHLFRRKWFVVAGGGVPSDRLDELVGMSNLFVDSPRCCSGIPPAYYIAYSYRIEGDPEDIEIIEASRDVHGPSNVEGKVSISTQRDIGSILDGNEGIVDMLLEIEIQIRSINRKDIYSPG